MNDLPTGPVPFRLVTNRRIALATATDTLEPDPDEKVMLEGFASAGWDVGLLEWDGPEADFAQFSAIVIRSTWNYIQHLDSFRAWIAEAGKQTRLYNPAEIVLENLHKGYLLGLASRGVPIVPTRLVKRGETATIAEAGKWVVKPAVGAGSWKVRVLEGDEVASYAGQMSQVEDVLIQPYMRSVEDGGERALVWVDGQFTHKVVKRLRTETDEEVVTQAQPLTEDEEVIGRLALRGLENRLLYARVDVMIDSAGQPVVSELELTEPSLFLKQNPQALERLIAGLEHRVGASGHT